jgi:hypothetical protein
MKAGNKAWYWLAAGVLALGLNGYYQDGGLRPLHDLAERTTLALADARAQFTQVATLAEVALADRAQARSQRTVPAVVAVAPEVIPAEAQLQERLGAMESARAQARMARFQEVIVRRELHRAQVELQNGRLAVLIDQGQGRVALPRVEINVPQVPAIEISPN